MQIFVLHSVSFALILPWSGQKVNKISKEGIAKCGNVLYFLFRTRIYRKPQFSQNKDSKSRHWYSTSWISACRPRWITIGRHTRYYPGNRLLHTLTFLFLYATLVVHRTLMSDARLFYKKSLCEVQPESRKTFVFDRQNCKTDSHHMRNYTRLRGKGSGTHVS